ncbi:MAG TPA: transglycosylase domain-containing protein, partial [Mycobacteriales bacterium]|nr:transglycosylase domain-containing protein [Mycobacteriales bacterium]
MRDRAMQALRRSRAASEGDSMRLRLILLVLSSIVAGVVVAGLALPVLGTVGLEARHEADQFDALPSVLAEPPLPQSSIVTDANGKILATFAGDENRTLVTIDQVPLVMQQAIIAVEDSRFYEHHGIDFRGTVRALVNNGSGGARQGGSTLTQQYVKNVLEHSADPEVRKEATDDTLARKLREARYALALERRYTKAQILEKYLNIANFGNGEYGVGTAAQFYFGKKVGQLTLPDAAMLAGIVNAPSAYDPLHHPEAARDRRRTVLNAMLKQGYISQAQFDSAVSSPLPNASHINRALDACQTSEAPLFCDYIRSEIELDPKLGATKQDRDNALFTGGLRIKTSLDMTTQNAMQTALNTKLPPNQRIVAMSAAVKPGTGEVLGLAADRPYGDKSKANPLLSKVNYPIHSFL